MIISTLRLVIEVPTAWWLSSNDRYHHMEKARRTRDIRALAAHRARGVQSMATPCAITATIAYPTARKADPPNAWPTCKAAIDGLVDAGVLPDDSSDLVPIHAFRRDPERSRRGHYRITLTLEELPCDAS